MLIEPSSGADGSVLQGVLVVFVAFGGSIAFILARASAAERERDHEWADRMRDLASSGPIDIPMPEPAACAYCGSRELQPSGKTCAHCGARNGTA